MVWAEVLNLPIRLLEVVQVILSRLPADDIIDSLASTLMLDHYEEWKQGGQFQNFICHLCITYFWRYDQRNRRCTPAH